MTNLLSARWRFSRVGAFITLSALAHTALLLLNFSNKTLPSDTNAVVMTVFLDSIGTTENSATRLPKTTPAPEKKVVQKQHQVDKNDIKTIVSKPPLDTDLTLPPQRKSAIVGTLPTQHQPITPVTTVPAALTDEVNESNQHAVPPPPDEKYLAPIKIPIFEQVTIVGILVGKGGIVEQAHVLDGENKGKLGQVAIQAIMQKHDFNLPSDAKYPVEMVFMVHHRFIGNQVITYIANTSLPEWQNFK